MPVAARQIDWEAWSQRRFLAWAETQQEGRRYEFDGSRPVAMAPATVGHNRIGRNIREAIRPRLPAGAPCDAYGPQDAIETVGGALREPDAFIACSRPHRNAVAVPAPIVVFEVVSPGRCNRNCSPLPGLSLADLGGRLHRIMVDAVTGGSIQALCDARDRPQQTQPRGEG